MLDIDRFGGDFHNSLLSQSHTILNFSPIGSKVRYYNVFDLCTLTFSKTVERGSWS